METENMIADTDAPVEAIVEAVEASNEAAVKVAKSAAKKRSKTAKRARRQSKPNVGAQKRIEDMTNDTNIFAGFGAFPGAGSFEKLFTDVAGRSEEVAKRSRKAAEELADISRGNVEAFVEAGRIAVSGAQSIGQDVVAKSRDSLEQTANTVRSFAEAKSPTELLQLQSDFARTAFDRFVEESSALTESFVKLAGEAFQPISNRASANVERFNQIAA
jgi:phasin family protein